MFAIRKLLALLRGSIHPVQVVLACVVGGLLAFVPDPWGVGRPLVAAHLALLLVLNASIPLTLLVWGPLGLLALAAMPVSFHLGRWLVDGPAHGVVAWAVNAPVLALLGFERYATVGGLVLGATCGLVAGLLVQKTLGAFRRKMAALEQGSERYGKVQQKVVHTWWLRLLLWVVAGKRKGGQSYADLLTPKRALPVRIPGVIVVALLGAVLFFAPRYAAEPVLKPMVASGLSTWNGATVDVVGLSVDLAQGRLVLSELALADPAALETDSFRADRLEAQLHVPDLLRRRFTIERVHVAEAFSGALRDTPGERVGPPPEASEPPAPLPGDTREQKTLEDLLADYDVWQERAARAREWLERLSPKDGEPAADAPPADEKSLRDDLLRRIAEQGYALVEARGLRDATPTLTIGEIVIDGLSATWLPDDPLDVRAANLSTRPQVLAQSTTLTARSRSGDFVLALDLGGVGTQSADGLVQLGLRGISAASLAEVLPRRGGDPLLREGAVDLSLDGTWQAGDVGRLDLPLLVTLRGVTFPGMSAAQRLDGVVLPFGLRGPMDNPRVSFDDDALLAALGDAARAALEQRARDEISGALTDRLGVDVTDEAAAQAALQAKKDEAEAAAKKAAQEALEKKTSSALDKLFGGKDDDEKDEPKGDKKSKPKAEEKTPPQ